MRASTYVKTELRNVRTGDNCGTYLIGAQTWLASALFRSSCELLCALCKSSRELATALFRSCRQLSPGALASFRQLSAGALESSCLLSSSAFLLSCLLSFLSFFRSFVFPFVCSCLRAFVPHTFVRSSFLSFLTSSAAIARSRVRAFVHSCIRSFSIAGLCYGPRGLALLHSKTIAESLSAAGAKNNCATAHSLHSVTRHAITCATFSLCQN